MVSRKKDAGQDLVEFAMLALPLFLLLFAILEFGVAVWRYNTVANAAREGARAAVLYGMTDREPSAKEAACDFLDRLGIPCDADTLSDTSNPRIDYRDATFVLDPDTGASKPMVEVTVTYQYGGVTGLTQLVAAGGIELSASSSMVVE